jgi:hypothetical protein
VAATEQQLKNIQPHQFKAGEPSANPGGRPRKRIMSQAYENFLAQLCEPAVRLALKLPANATYADAVATGLGRRAMRGDAAAAKELREAIEGKATQRIEIAGENQLELVVRFEPPIGLRPKKIEKSAASNLIDVEPEREIDV